MDGSIDSCPDIFPLITCLVPFLFSRVQIIFCFESVVRRFFFTLCIIMGLDLMLLNLSCCEVHTTVGLRKLLAKNCTLSIGDLPACGFVASAERCGHIKLSPQHLILVWLWLSFHLPHTPRHFTPPHSRYRS